MFRVARLATICDRTGQLRLSREFGLNLGEWRVLSVVRALAPVTLAEVARELCLDKGQLSRTTYILIGSGLLSHSESRRDRRQTLFELTAEGQRLHDQVIAFALERHSDLTSTLSAREQAKLFQLLEKVTAQAERSYGELFGQQARTAGDRGQPRESARPLQRPARQSRTSQRRNARRRSAEQLAGPPART